MAPDRGSLLRPGVEDAVDITENHEDAMDTQQQRRRRSDARKYLAEHAAEGQSFTVRSVVVGIGVGIIICFSNMYFGLQTGWISGMTMPSSLIGFAVFKTFAKHLSYPFTPVENVLVQTVAGAVGTMPLACGFVGVMPALEYLLTSDENGPLGLGIKQLMIWSLGVCFFGVVFAVPLRREVIIRERLKFPSGTATALMIGVLHGDSKAVANKERENRDQLTSLMPDGGLASRDSVGDVSPQTEETSRVGSLSPDARSSWKAKVKLLTLTSYFIPALRDLPVFGLPLARTWLWTLNPSPAYVGQGIIMGPTTTLHMLLGAVVGWGVLSPLAKSKGWAPGPVSNWEHGSKGWIVWVSLAIMLADSLISLSWLTGQPLIGYCRRRRRSVDAGNKSWRSLFRPWGSTEGYRALASDGSVSELDETRYSSEDSDMPEDDVPPEHLVGTRTVIIGLIASILFCIGTIRFVFGELVPMYATVTAVILALLLSIMGVRALGETDLNPVSGISKLTQLFFSLIIPQSNRNSVLINLIAGAVSEAGAQEAGDLMQDLKTGHLLGAVPKAQFHGQLIGSFVGAITSAAVYKLYTTVYPIPGDLFQVPTAYVWIFTARLVTGKGLPPMAREWASGAAVLFAVGTCARLAGKGKRWHCLIPSGIAVAVGMYNVPSFTLARAVGGLLSWYWRSYRRREETPVIVLASGLILGEGVVSIASLVLASLKVAHL
ncbi:hypothetical protein GP486_002943 [Trichoglossum hirsutum]|uniref:Oligopeptide transporter n=1 Tax=Trichoglossum hirsutum TaxID=265104 RepID=A0A9P8RRM0_9PEZI|nr:hypothetical protein GP486_002943 [Trichoglossum hirsutum]